MKNSPVDTLINLIIIGENGIILFAIVKIWNQKTNKKRYEWIEKLPILFLSNGMQTINISAPNLLGICFGQQAPYFIHRIFPAIFLVFFSSINFVCVLYKPFGLIRRLDIEQRSFLALFSILYLLSYSCWKVVTMKYSLLLYRTFFISCAERHKRKWKWLGLCERSTFNIKYWINERANEKGRGREREAGGGR